MMTTLSEFLLARIAEDEAVARAAVLEQPQEYHDGPRVDDGRWAQSPYSYDSARVEGIGITIYDEGGHTDEQAAHIARHDPARVLAECEAKRRIVERVDRYKDEPRDDFSGWQLGDEILADLALPYADHPDYREEWKP